MTRDRGALSVGSLCLLRRTLDAVFVHPGEGEGGLGRADALPYTITVREPSEEAMKAVVRFATKTGDFYNLSATDVRVMALTWTLEKEHNGVEHLAKEPATVCFFSYQCFLIVRESVRVCVVFFFLFFSVNVSFSLFFPCC